MYLIINKFNKDNIFLNEKQENNILQGSDFYRIQYSDENLTLNSIYLKLKFYNVKINKYFNKLKCIFPKIKNEECMKNINKIENIIINKYKPFLTNREPKFIINEQIIQNYIKIVVNNKNIEYEKIKDLDLILKISGIWVNKKSYGLTFRFLIY
jgi:hypothetical protein